MGKSETEIKTTADGIRTSCPVSLSKIISAVCAAILFSAVCVTALRGAFPVKYSAYVKSAAQEFDLPENEVCAVIRAESGFDKNAVSPAGAKGLMQLMPETARFCASLLQIDYDDEDIFDPEVNIRLGCCYLNYLKARFDGDWVYAAYNAGEGRVTQWLNSGGTIPIRETSDYVSRVTLYKKIYKIFYRL